MIPIFLAVDTSDIAVAQRLLVATSDLVDVKFGMQFFFAHGWSGVNKMANMGASRPREVFLDLKIHDIHATDGGAIMSLLPLEVDYITMHIGDDASPLETAVGVASLAPSMGYKRPKLLGVTVLTSVAGMNSFEFKELVRKRAFEGMQAGLDGLVTSGHEVAMLRSMFPDAFLMVPGISMSGNTRDEQKRVITPRMAQDAGASGIVVGRDITKADDPEAAAQAIRDSLS